MLLHILDGLSEPAIGLDLLFFQLSLEPLFQAVHQVLALGLMPSKALLSGQVALAGNRVVVIHVAQHFQDMAALCLEVIEDIHEVASAVGHAMYQDGLEVLGQVA